MNKTFQKNKGVACGLRFNTRAVPWTWSRAIGGAGVHAFPRTFGAYRRCDDLENDMHKSLSVDAPV